MIRFYAAVLTIGTLFTHATGACPDPVSSDGDNVFLLGEPVTLEPCGSGFPNSTQFVRRIFLDELSTELLYMERYSDSSSEGATVLIPNLPGEFRIRRSGNSIPPGQPFVENGFFNVVRDCPTDLPPPAADQVFRPKISGRSLLDSGFSHITLDNSVAELAKHGIFNEGESDLVLIDVFEPFEDGIVTVYPTNFVPYMTIKPGSGFALELSATVLDPEKLQTYSTTTLARILIVRSNDPERPVCRVSLSAIDFFPNAESVPPGISPVNDPLPPPEPCGDLNDDGVLDSADVILRLLGEKP